mmetsp:Transcript_41260/g.41994  ORF Transcript_41260/g.41994 Transcript_41260/m.41994 type:complete len:133 (+) Transcript_41260:1-399(+)
MTSAYMTRFITTTPHQRLISSLLLVPIVRLSMLPNKVQERRTHDNQMNNKNNGHNHIDTTVPGHVVSMDRPPVQAYYMDELFFTRSFQNIYTSASILFEDAITPSPSQNRRSITTTVSLQRRDDCPQNDWRK